MFLSSRALVALVGTLLAVSACAPKQKAAHGPPPLNVDVARAQMRDIATYVTLDGQVAPLEDSTLTVQQSGPLTGIYVNVGDAVRTGQLLARVDDSTLRAQLAQDQALIAQSSARAQSSAASVPITQSQTSAAVAQARAQLANAQLQYDQDLQLYRQGYVSQSQLAIARAAYVQAQGQVQTAVAQTGNINVSSANAQADRAAVASAQAQANTLQTQIGQTALYAPFDGIVTARLLDPGANASAGSPVLRLSEISTVWINVNVPDENLAYIHNGTPVTFSTSGGGKTYRGHVESVNAVPTSGTLSYLARIRQPNPGNALRGGMLVSVNIQKANHPHAIVVPRTAIAQTDRGSSVFVVVDNKAVEAPVSVGLQTDTLSEVRSPRVHPGSVVVTTRPDALQDGSVVAISASAPTSG
ncbi:MAG: efflux RND transporter periplasmic adaptor subunit, partial [Candidatus Eremiobacteraeota bacterium]|nr:efflux RND transporter periplasmic adaptor subunit [Candidatus Eremiobacteraeota bacterium]